MLLPIDTASITERLPPIIAKDLMEMLLPRLTKSTVLRAPPTCIPILIDKVDPSEMKLRTLNLPAQVMAPNTEALEPMRAVLLNDRDEPR
jgi:hypothetical protein